MIRNGYDRDVGGMIKIAALAVLFIMFAMVTVAYPSVKKTVTIKFLDSAMVNDTLIRIGDIAKVSSDDQALLVKVKEFVVGEAAPAGYSRFINTSDLVAYRIRPQFNNIDLIDIDSRRIKVVSDHRERSVKDFENEIRAYVSERLSWADGDWELTINNKQNTWKSGRGEEEVTISGIDNPYTKGNTSLTLTVRQGARVSRIPITCRITVKTNVLIASRQIQRGEELTTGNSRFAVTDITNFAYAPLTSLPEPGTMTVYRSVTAGGILHGKLLAPIPTVAKGDQVRIHFIGERVKVSVLGVARDSGRNGDRIWVENLHTKKLIRAAVSGRGSVVVHNEREEKS